MKKYLYSIIFISTFSVQDEIPIPGANPIKKIHKIKMTDLKITGTE